MGEVIPDDMWTPYKQLRRVVETFLSQRAPDGSLATLELILQKHKSDFVNLLKNSPKNTKCREEIQKGITDGVNLPGLGHTILSKDLVDESIIISDMFDLNEYKALELLCTAQQQIPHHPGLPRGLVAILLYYDGRKTLVTTLKELFQARYGVSWCTDASQDITTFITNYTDGLVADGLLNKIIDLLEQLDVTKEIALLSENRALGPAKHHRQVLDSFDEIRLQLATTLYCWSAQSGLRRDTTLKLIRYLAKYTSEDPRGGIDDVTLALLMALLYALDLSVLQKRDDGEEVVLQLPVIDDANYIKDVYEALINEWKSNELRSVALFALALTIATLRQAPQNLQQNATDLIDQHEILAETAIQGKVFDYIYHILLDKDTVFRTEFYFRRIHLLLTDFIEYMHSKVNELRARADETARTIQIHQQQGLDPPPNLDRHFETLLLTVGKLYSNDKMNLNLDLEYWGPMETSGNYQHRSSNRSVSLFKFIRLAGELLPPILLIPYLKMMAGLSSCQQSARNAFNLLKQGSNISGSTTLSWEHFFGSISRYYTTLRQEQHPATDTVYRSRALNRNISPLELAGLQAVLAVIKAVATHDEVARIALCEHPSWAPLHVLLGLVSCSIDIALKTDILLTLAALAKSKETAMQLWLNLEASQIITTIPTTQSFSTVPRGIESEIDKTESRNETYPLTQAILDLLYTLSSTIMPRNLGAGPRKPGIIPYYNFILESIFLKFYNRIYKDEAEKWAVAEKCLKILDYFIRTYEINPVDFPVSGQNKEEYPPPGFYVMLEMNTNEKSDLLKLLLHIIDEACSALDSYTQFPGKAKLENCVLFCLNIIERSLTQRERFFDAHFESKCSILLAGLNKLLLGINYRSGKPDHMLNIVKYVTYNNWLPRQALLSVRILSHVTRQPGVHTLLLSEFTRTTKLANEIRHGFVECLESDLPVFDSEEIENEKAIDINGDDIELTIKEEIIKLLEECLPHSAPNVSHYLLGFDISKDIRATLLQQPGVLDFPSNCTKSLITILDEGIQQIKSGIEIPFSQQRLLQNGYRLLYTLCSNPKTSEVILRFLRECKEFLLRHISMLPFHQDNNPFVLNQMTGLLKCVAIELKITANHQQVKQFKNLSDVLLGSSKITANHQQVKQFKNLSDVLLGSVKCNASSNAMNTQDPSNSYSIANSTSMFATAVDSTMFGKSIAGNYRKTGGRSDGSTDLLICKLLECLDFDMKQLDRPKWDFFDNALMDQSLQSCIVPPDANANTVPKLLNIRKLHDILRDELNIVQSTIASGQRQLILSEIETVLKYAVDLNAQKNRLASTVRFMEAWSQVTEILFAVAPIFALCYEERGGYIIEILQSLLTKVTQVDVMPEMGRLASPTLLQMLVCLRHWYRHSNVTIDSNGLAHPSKYNGNHSHASGTSLNINSALTPKTNSLSLKYILKNIVDWIIISGEASQKLKINLYASLLNFMHIVKGFNANESGLDNPADNYVSRLDKSMSRAVTNGGGKTDLTQLAVEVFNSVGDKIVDILCHDCTGGHDVCKVLALSCIDMLLDIDSMVNFIQFIARRDYLAHLVDGLLKSDDYLCRVLENVPDNMKALFVYESKMAMLGRVASSYVGAELLLEHRALAILSGMKVYDMHPDFQVNNYIAQQYSEFIPPVDIRYQQILFPALNLCDIIISTLGPENYSAITQVVHFLLSHGDMIEVVLRAGTPFLNIGLLQELSAITGLIARSANQDISNLIEPTTSQDLGAHLYRLQKLMMNLFPRFIVSESTIKEMSKTNIIAHDSQLNLSRTFISSSGSDTQQKTRTLQTKYFLQIACNLALYSRNAIVNHSADHRATGVLFSPTISEGLQRYEIRSGTLETSPSLGIVVSQLKNCVEYYNREKCAYDALLRQRKALEGSLHINQRDQQQYEALSEKLLNKQDELKYCIFLTENCLYLLWAHLDFFMLRAISVNPLQLNRSNRPCDSPITSSIDAGWKVTADDVSILKKTLVQIFTETFCKQLIATTQDPTSADKSFVEALLRRIKHLIQFVPVK